MRAPGFDKAAQEVSDFNDFFPFPVAGEFRRLPHVAIRADVSEYSIPSAVADFFLSRRETQKRNSSAEQLVIFMGLIFNAPELRN